MKKIIFNSQTGYDKASDMVGDIGYSHVAMALGTWFHQLDQYPKLYAAEEAAPIIQALLLLMVYTFLPLALVFTSYRAGKFYFRSNYYFLADFLDVYLAYCELDGFSINDGIIW